MIGMRTGSWGLVAAVLLAATSHVRVAAASTAGGVRDVRMDHLALDAEIASDHGGAYLEWTRREVEGVSPDDFPAEDGGHPAGAGWARRCAWTGA